MGRGERDLRERRGWEEAEARRGSQRPPGKDFLVVEAEMVALVC